MPDHTTAVAVWPHDRLPWVDDLKVRRCFICMEEDVSVPGVRRSRVQHGFVHACSCTLVAHERCLFDWMDTGDETRRRCAQCKKLYVIVRDARPSSLALRVFNATSNLVSTIGMGALTLSVACLAATTIYGSFTLYGLYAARCTVGREFFNHFFIHSTRRPDLAWTLLPILPMGLFMPNVHRGLPYQVLMSVAGLSFYLLEPSQTAAISWPPSPRFLIPALPLISNIYRKGMRRLERRLLGELSYKYALRISGYSAAEDAAVGNVDPRVAAAQLRERMAAPPQVAQAQNNVHPRVFGRGLFSMLVMPPLAGGMGRLLRHAAMYSRSLPIRTFLGMTSGRLVAESSTFVSSLSRAIRSAITTEPISYDFEPVWWQSLIGLGLVTIGKDVLLLGYKVLMHKDRNDHHLSIVDLPFEGVDIRSLDLMTP